MSRLNELADKEAGSAFEDAWFELLDRDPSSPELLESLAILVNRGEEKTALVLAETAVEKMESDDFSGLLEFASGAAAMLNRSDLVATALVESLRDKYLLFEPLETFIAASGILSGKKPLKDSWKRLEQLIALQVGNFVIHRNFGPGEILQSSRSSYTIDFRKSRNHDMTLKTVMESTTPVPEDSLYVLSWKKPDLFASLLSEDREKLLSLAFRDLATKGTLKETDLLPLLNGSNIKPHQMWKTLKAAASNSHAFMNLGSHIIPADGSSLQSRVEAVLSAPGMAMSQKAKTIAAFVKSASATEVKTLEQIFDRVVSIKDIEKGAVFEIAWLCSGNGNVKKFSERTQHLVETKAARLQRALKEIHSVPCRKLYMKQFFSSEPEESEIVLLLDKLPRTMREHAADYALSFSPETHDQYVLRCLDNPGATGHFMWALERAAKLDSYMPPEKIVALALKNLNFAKSDMQKRICSVLMNKLRPALEQHISLLDTRRLETLTAAIETNIRAQESGLVLLASRELSGRRTGSFTNIRKFWETDSIFSSRDGIARLADEIEDIRTVQVPLAAKAIAEAASHGDLSENAEYTAALEKRDFLLETLNRFQKQLKRMRPYPRGQITADVVSPATKVVLESMDSDAKVRELSIVGPMDADSENGYINYKAPLGASLLGLSKGDTVQLPGDKNTQWRIADISLLEELL